MSLLPLTDLRLLIRVTTTTQRLASPRNPQRHPTTQRKEKQFPKHSSHIIIEIGKTCDAKTHQSTTAAQSFAVAQNRPTKKTSQHKVTQCLDYHLQHPAPPESPPAAPSHDPGPEPTDRRRRPLSRLLALRLCYGRSTDRDTEEALMQRSASEKTLSDPRSRQKPDA